PQLESIIFPTVQDATNPTPAPANNGKHTVPTTAAVAAPAAAIVPTPATTSTVASPTILLVDSPSWLLSFIFNPASITIPALPALEYMDISTPVLHYTSFVIVTLL